MHFHFLMGIEQRKRLCKALEYHFERGAKKGAKLVWSDFWLLLWSSSLLNGFCLGLSRSEGQRGGSADIILLLQCSGVHCGAVQC